jgi:hypothetical protein
MPRRLNNDDPNDSLTDGSMVAFGENPGGFTAVTVNGLAHDKGPGSNHDYWFGPGYNGPRWEMPRAEAEIIGGGPVSGAIAAPTKRSGPRTKNRTGE